RHPVDVHSGERTIPSRHDMVPASRNVDGRGIDVHARSSCPILCVNPEIKVCTALIKEPAGTITFMERGRNAGQTAYLGGGTRIQPGLEGEDRWVEGCLIRGARVLNTTVIEANRLVGPTKGAGQALRGET